MSKGLGDTLENVFKQFKIDQIAKKVAKITTGKEDCGCEKRKQMLNERFPYNK
jgi:ribosome maturation protein Sdo1